MLVRFKTIQTDFNYINYSKIVPTSASSLELNPYDYYVDNDSHNYIYSNMSDIIAILTPNTLSPSHNASIMNNVIADIIDFKPSK